MNFRCRSGAFGAIVLSALTLSCLQPSPANSASVYRCGNSYSQVPCGNSAPMVIEDARSDEQRRDSVSAQRANSRLANQMERDRLKFESENKPHSGVVGATSVVMTKANEKKGAQTAHAHKDARATKPKATLNTDAAAPFVAHASAHEGAEKPAKTKKKRAKKSE